MAKIAGTIVNKPLAGTLFSKSFSLEKKLVLPPSTEKKIVQSVVTSKQVVNAVKNAVKNNLNNNSFEEITSITYTGLNDLALSIGSADLEIIGTKLGDNYWNIDVKMSDIWNFDEKRNNKYGFISDSLNNFGYGLQNTGLTKAYYWEVTFIFSYKHREEG